MAAVSINENGCTALRSSYRCEAFLGMSKNHQKHGFGTALAMDGTCPQFDCDPLLGVGSDPLLMVLVVIPYWVMFGTAHDPSNPEPGEQVERW